MINQVPQVAKLINNILHEDTGIRIPVKRLEAALVYDLEQNGHLPSAEECDTLVTGGETGMIPEGLTIKFSQTYQLINDQ